MSYAGNDIRTLQIAGDTVDWTLASAPSDIMVRRITVRNSQPIDTYIRTNAADPTTQDVIPANFERTFEFSLRAMRTGLFYFQFASGTGPLILQCNT